ncbi:MAG: bifunctional phosphopantothenoylcysteine decarboxylase/phosphopantothenate--cysteine ligase CoaBC [Burkholderiales bacterium]|nr:bifunctional phosphopantothenoylcysteine decarboxylase/phosphopantothenate--cysteine ligase CoaBC [Burkholderiales bacterium]
MSKTALSTVDTTVTHPPARIVLGLTGGIAAYKSAELLRLLTKAGHNVQVAMTASAERFITPTTMQALSGQPVWTSLWDDAAVPGARPNGMTHIEITRQAALIVIAPASADFLAKLAHGFADDLLSTACLARNAARTHLAVAPAMNREMWENPATQRNIAILRADGISIWGPEGGDQACGEVGMGRMREPADLFADVQRHFRDKASTGLLAGRKVLVTAGPTFESIDPVRGLTNRSSGKMGYEIAAAAKAAGAAVTLVTGPTALPPPVVDTVLPITSAEELFNAVDSQIDDIDIFFSVAAVADYTPMRVAPQKMKKSGESLKLTLMPTKDVLAHVASQKRPPFCVGFAAESEKIVEYAAKKREKKQIPLIVANHANSAIGADDNEVTMIWNGGSRLIARAPKSVIAREIIAEAAQRYAESLVVETGPKMTSSKSRKKGRN